MLAGPLQLDPERVRYRRILESRAATAGWWPEWVPDGIREAVRSVGIEQPWHHQSAAAEAIFGGRHTALTTGTASGKSLAYLLPVLTATYGGPEARGPQPSPSGDEQSRTDGGYRTELLRPRRPHTALYLAPTKALAHDQLRAAQALAPEGWRTGVIDGDSEPAERDWIREYASFVFTNPDLIHRSMLPQHQRWASFLGSLRYVVIDESHRYRGVFGAHVAAVIRRLRRICAVYGSDPVFVLASATANGADRSAAELIGCAPEDVTVVAEDTSPHGRVEISLWEPERTPTEDAARLLAELVDAGSQTVAFIASRRLAELVAVQATRRLTGPGRIESYRSGYLASDRRVIEHALQSGAVNGVAATNALELGVDIAGLDAVVITGFPGTRSALWQQAGRAGRRGGDAQVVLIAAQNPLDVYLFEHPELLFDTAVEETVLHADNPYVLGPHLAAAAQEVPLRADDERWFGAAMRPLVERLERQGVLRRRPNGWFWTRGERAVDAIDLRAIGDDSIEIVEADTGRVLGHVDEGAADGTVHEGAVYLHQGESYLVDVLDHQEHEAIVRAARPGYTTQPRGTYDLHVLGERAARPFGHGRLHFGDVEVRSRVIGYLRRDELTGRVWDETPLDLPEHTLRTTAVWWTMSVQSDLAETMSLTQLGAAAHAAEHTAIGILPLFAPCDRWDIGGLSTVLHPDTGQLSVFVHDGHPGGAGFAERGFAVAEKWWSATEQRLRACGCEQGCPACVVSPKCGNANQMLDKSGAVRLLAALLSGIRAE